jgi:hypothetical protein
MCHQYNFTRLSAVESAPAAWLWPEYVPLGGITVIEDDPGWGKSTLTERLAARLSRG